MKSYDQLALAYRGILPAILDIIDPFANTKKPRPVPDGDIFKMSYRDGVDPVEYIKEKLMSFGWKEGGLAIAQNGTMFPVWYARDGKLYGMEQKKGYVCKRSIPKHATIVRMDEIKKDEEKHGNQ